MESCESSFDETWSLTQVIFSETCTFSLTKVVSLRHNLKKTCFTSKVSQIKAFCPPPPSRGFKGQAKKESPSRKAMGPEKTLILRSRGEGKVFYFFWIVENPSNVWWFSSKNSSTIWIFLRSRLRRSRSRRTSTLMWGRPTDKHSWTRAFLHNLSFRDVLEAFLNRFNQGSS